MNSLDSLDGKWISVDHTLLDSAAASISKDSASGVTALSVAQIQDALNKLSAVNKQYLFTTNSAHAVLKDPKSLGKSTRDGREVYSYTVGYDKAHLKAYIKAAQTAVASSSLNDWVKQVSGKSAGALDLSSLLKSIDTANGNYTFTMYVDAKTKLVSDLHFKDPKSSDYIEIGQHYTGGSTYPFSFKMVSTTDPSLSGTLTLNATLNSSTNVLNFDAGFDGKDSSKSPVTVTFKANMVPSNDTVNITAPAGATSVLDLLKTLNLGSLLGGSNTGSGTDVTLPFTLTQ